MDPYDDCAVITLGSGQTLKLQRVMLYKEDTINEIAALRAKASSNFGGVSTGLGFIGSPTWVIGGATILGLLEGALSSSAKKQGMAQLQLAQKMFETLNLFGQFFRIVDIVNFRIPHPEIWRATSADNVQFVFNGDEFATVDTDAGLMHIRWSHVVAYRPPEIPIVEEKATSQVSLKPHFKDMKSFPAGTTIYNAKGVRLAGLPNGQFLVEMPAGDVLYESAMEYRQISGDQTHWDQIGRC